MRPTLVSASGVMAALLMLSACGGGESSSQNDDGSGLSVASVGDSGTVLVDADGNPVYTNEAEVGGTIKCVDACIDFWPPVEIGALPDEIVGVDGTFGTTKRPDGTTQVTLDDYPLYTFAEDAGKDTVEGDGFEDDFQGSHFVWHVVTASDAATTNDGDDGGGYGGGYGGY